MGRNKILKTRHVLTLANNIVAIAADLGLPPEAEEKFIRAFFQEWINITDIELTARKADDETSRTYAYKISK